MSLVRQRSVSILVLLTVLGGLWRLASFQFNVWPHGDVVIDAAISESVAWHGRLLVPFVDVRYYPVERFGFGYPLDQHPPLWPLLGAPLVWLTGDGYAALKLVSLLVGTALIPLAYLALRRHVGNGPALFASALTAGSFPLVDFSGNGSLWVLLAACYLGWLWVVPGSVPLTSVPQWAPQATPLPATTGPAWSGSGLERGQGRWRWVLLGVVMALGYLTNYPAVVLPVALLVLHVVRHGRGAFRPAALAGPALSAIVMVLAIAPWLLFNASVFGGPFWSQPFQRTLSGGSRDVEYLLVDGGAIKRNLPATGNRMTALRARALDLYGNVGFLAKQSLVLTPVLGGLFLVGLLLLVPGADVRKRKEAGDGALVDTQARTGPVAVALLALVHLALIVWWPTTKFRYLIPLLPLVFAVGAWGLWQLQPGLLRSRLAAVTLGLCLFTNAWSMLSIPSRTFYYDGGLIGDNFGQQGERIFVDEARSFKAAADAIVAHGRGVILSDHILAPFTRMPLVVNSTGYSTEVVEYLVKRYGIRYIVIDVPHARQYDFLRPTPIWTNDRHVVLELPDH
jgi:4-amino-4-deoxy-L-arabinose transferase-like glycosyltransferase